MKRVSIIFGFIILSLSLQVLLQGCENFLEYENDYEEYDDSWGDDYQGWDAALYTELSITSLAISSLSGSDKPVLDMNVKNTGDAVCNSAEVYTRIKKGDHIINEGISLLGDVPMNYNSSAKVYFQKAILYDPSYNVEVIISWYNKEGDYFETISYL